MMHNLKPMHTALAAWVAVLAAALRQSEPAPCASSFALESPPARPTTATSAAARRGACNVRAAARPALPGHCASRAARLCRRPAACLGRAALVAGRGSRGDACVVAQGRSPACGGCPTDCAAARGNSDPLADASRAFAPTGSRASRTRRSPCRDNAASAARRQWHDERWHGDVEPDGNFHCPVDCSRTHEAKCRTVSRRARRRSRAGRILDPRGLGASRSQRSCPAGASSSRTRWPASADPAM